MYNHYIFFEFQNFVRKTKTQQPAFFFSQILNQNEQINFSSTQNLNPQIAPKSIHITLSLSLSLSLSTFSTNCVEVK